MGDSSDRLKLAIASDGALYEPSLLFLDACGLRVNRENPRRYTATIPFLKGMSVLFQRSMDITAKIEDGDADLGIIGQDRYLELRKEDGPTNIIMDNLGFSSCALSIGVPDSWIDVDSVADLADLAADFHERGSTFRVATKSPRLLQRFLISNGISNFSLVQSSGTLEVAPAMGFADIIADITSSGTTMRENHLKMIEGGTIIQSEACLIANSNTLDNNLQKKSLATRFTEIISAHMNAEGYFSVTANMKGDSQKDLADALGRKQQLKGIVGPSITAAYGDDLTTRFAVTILVERAQIMEVVGEFRSMGSETVSVSQLNYVFES